MAAFSGFGKALPVLFAFLLLSTTCMAAGYSGSIILEIPAVEKTEGGERGSLASLQISIKEGDGHVFVDTVPLTEIDTQAGARIAKQAVEETLGISLDNYDIFYVIRSDAPTISGPSAGAAMATGLMSLVLNLSIDRSVVMTGTCSPDGSIGHVGGILEKAEAVANSGASLFLIPKGQGTITIENSSAPGSQGNVITEAKRIIVSDYARSMWNLSVVEVSDITDAMKYMTGYAIARKDPDIREDSIMEESMREMSMKFIEETDTAIARAEQSIAGSGMDQKSKSDMATILDEQKKKLDDARKSQDAGEYYTASSFCFTASIELERIEKAIELNASLDKVLFAGTFLNSTAKNIEDAEKMVEAAEMRIDNASDIEVILLSYERINEARNYLSEASKSIDAGNYDDSIFYTSYADERAETVKRWIALCDRFSGSPFWFSFSEISGLSRLRLVETISIANYAEILGIDTSGIEAMISIARKNFNSGNYEYALFNTVAIEASAEASIVFSGIDINDTNSTAEKIAKLEYNALREIGSAQQRGVTPIMALNYYEYGKHFEASDTAVAVNYLVYSKHFARIAEDIDAVRNGKDFSIDAALVRSGSIDAALGYRSYAVVMIVFIAGIVTGIMIVSLRRKEKVPGGYPPKPKKFRRAVISKRAGRAATKG